MQGDCSVVKMFVVQTLASLKTYQERTQKQWKERNDFVILINEYDYTE